MGLKTKILAGYIFTRVVSNNTLTSEVKNMAAHIIQEPDITTFNLLNDIALVEIPADGATCKKVMTSLQQSFTLTEKEAAAILLAIAAAPSPAQVNDAVIETTLKHLAPEGIVEIIV